MARSAAAPLSCGRPKGRGYRDRLSVLQAEFSLTQIWDRPRHGREFFEEVTWIIFIWADQKPCS